MELSNLTICRQDVIVVSDSEAKGNQEQDSNKKKKSKKKIECVRKVQLTRMMMERTVPYCYRKRCRDAQYNHKKTSKNTKYSDKGESAEKVERKSNRSDNMSVPREICSPITIKSSSDTYEQVSPCDLNRGSTDSDELEDLIKLTRQRMKNEKQTVKFKPQIPASATTTQRGHRNNLSELSAEGSLNSIDTMVLRNNNIMYSPISPNSLSVDMNKDMEHDEESKHSDIPSLFSEKSNSMSPLYEISGKVFMEHYLNTSI